MLFNEQQINELVSDFERRLCSGEIKKTVLLNSAVEYTKGRDEQDKQTIFNVDTKAPLFTMSMKA
ncbi:MAG: hypothetical protein LBL49_10480 [Clostridiales Family XIII bacterium]|jgi:hypothetical protein|nr:hypothetical protein [Clostridiales Family XIII bacterium]